MSRARRFTKEFEAEAVQLVQTSGRTHRRGSRDRAFDAGTLDRPKPGSANRSPAARPPTGFTHLPIGLS